VRHTKIIATLGPASSERRIIEAIIAAGVDVVRLNFSHGDTHTHEAAIDAARQAARSAGKHVAILQDLSGPKIRTGALEGGVPLQLKAGDALEITCCSLMAASIFRLSPFQASASRRG
jgi:pyruvate kinase